jgi:GPI ethanolamine phosphate transferase 1
MFGFMLYVWIHLEVDLFTLRSTSSSDRRYQLLQSPLLAMVSPSDSDEQSELEPLHIAWRPLEWEDARIALFFIFFLNFAFFGTGNIASLSSFTLESIYRLVVVFNPFLMGALLIYKLLLPFFLLSSVFRVLSHLLWLPPFSLFLLALSTMDIVTLNFFFLVRDSGSWLEIGVSISHFVITNAFILFVIVLFTLSHVLVGSISVPMPWKKSIYHPIKIS